MPFDPRKECELHSGCPARDLCWIAQKCRELGVTLGPGTPIATEDGYTPAPADAINPKDLVAEGNKAAIGTLPAAGKILGALATENGAAKYGAYNWRQYPVKMSVYLDAMERHLLALRDGEDVDPDSGVHHLGHIIAGASILADARLVGNLVDDRPKGAPTGDMLRSIFESRKIDNEKRTV